MSSAFIVSIYLAAIVAANLSVVAFGPGATIVNAFIFIGLDLSARDALHDAWKNNRAVKMCALIALGGALSWLLNRGAGQVALASTVAFVAAAVADTVVYSALGNRARLLRVNGSNVAGALVDSVIFPILAFGWPPMAAIIAGQFIAKVSGGLIWSLILNKRPTVQK